MPGWSLRNNQRWTALFQRFDVFQRWFREHEKHQRWSDVSELISSDLLSISAVQNWKFQRWTALNRAVSVRISSECERSHPGLSQLDCLDRAPKMQDSVLLNFWDSFLVTLPSVSSEICAIYSSVIPGADEFCNWLFLEYSCVFFAIAAHFRLFLNVVIFGKKLNNGEDWKVL